MVHRTDRVLVRNVWVRHWRSGRWGLVFQIWEKKYLIYFPDLEVFEWRWASAFYVPSHPSCVARSCGELGPHPRGG